MAFDQTVTPSSVKSQEPDLDQYFRPNQSGGIVGNPTGAGQNLFDQLSKRASQNLSFDPNTDPVIKPQVDAAMASNIRAGNNQINSMAESGNPYATGALNNTRTQAMEAAGQNTANLQAQLGQNELNARRGEIQSALAQQGGMLTTDQQLALQRQLGQTNAALGKFQTSGNLQLGAQGLNNQNAQYYSGLEQQDKEFLKNLGLGYANLGLGQQQLNSQNDQFNANFGLQAQNQGNYWDALRSGQLG